MERKACQAEGTAYAKAVSQQEQVGEGQLDEIREALAIQEDFAVSLQKKRYRRQQE